MLSFSWELVSMQELVCSWRKIELADIFYGWDLVKQKSWALGSFMLIGHLFYKENLIADLQISNSNQSNQNLERLYI